MFAVDVNFAEHRESHAVSRATERFNLFFATRLLTQKLVARKAQYAKTFAF